ncbi:hypothetical protein RH915_08055 [Serpentinicella sp. ANB-PHB4]|uniref:hypothetical protein n=1 Tax=Serpentinicella sp. ANB-PHB4 TaxID=3074076 RepID=UPI002863DC2C|nr:hypothetical protein [Serpentinicella sp. ANB-PHB4]MDR5659442.1 hypothetical protein [Serpentinicella sp. ANB-PHB4]
MDVLVGNESFINKINTFLMQSENVEDVYIHGFLSKDLVGAIKEYTNIKPNELSVKILIPKLSLFKKELEMIKREFDNVNYNIKINNNSLSQFIVFNNAFVILSGKTGENESVIKNKVAFMHSDDLGTSSVLKDLFYEDWKTGYSVYL